jgi:outer membrane biosynthesis protein TonB
VRDLKDPSFFGFVLSLILHAICLLFAIGGFLWGPTPVDAPQLISVDLMTLGPQTQAPRPKPRPIQSAPQSPQKKTPPPEPEPEPEPLPEPPQEAPLKPILETLEPETMPLPQEKSEPNPEAVPLPEKKPKPSKPKPSKSKPPKKAVEKKKEASKAPSQKKADKKPKKNSLPKTDGLDSLLNEIESEQNTLSTLDSLLDTDLKSTSNTVAPATGTLTISEKDFIRQRIRKFWSPPQATQKVGIVVVVNLEMERDGRIRHVTIDHTQGTLQHPQYQIAAESILRALQNPQFTLPLPVDKFSEWKTLKLNVSPENF